MVYDFLPDVTVVAGNPAWIRAVESHGLVHREKRDGVRWECPCCHYPTLEERDAFETCPLCDWEDDGQDDFNADDVKGGPNADYSLAEARSNFKVNHTMYRPGQHGFYGDTRNEILAVRQRIIDAFEELRSAPRERVSQLWDQVAAEVISLDRLRYS